MFSFVDGRKEIMVGKVLVTLGVMASGGCLAEGTSIQLESYRCHVPSGYVGSGPDGTIFYNRSVEGVPTFSLGRKDSDLYASYKDNPNFEITASEVVNGIGLTEVSVPISESSSVVIYLAEFSSSYVLFSKSSKEVAVTFLMGCTAGDVAN